jgi:deazaflavin-dependent oxidoreductase (nitroreductase family)
MGIARVGCGRRLWFDEALMERALMPAELHRHRQGGASHDDGCEVRVAAHTSADIDQQLRGLLAIGSNYGRAKHPAWSANLPAHPECTIEFMGPPTKYCAELLTGDARAAAWATATDFYAGYERYRASCAPREIRVFRLRPTP